MPVLRAVSFVLGGVLRLLLGTAVRAGRAQAARPGPAPDPLRPLRRVHAAACAADVLIVLGALRLLLAPARADLRTGGALAALAAGAVLAAAGYGALRYGHRLAGGARYVPVAALAGRAGLAWWLAQTPPGATWYAVAGGLLALSLAQRTALAAVIGAVAAPGGGPAPGPGRPGPGPADLVRARVRLAGVVAGIAAAPVGLVVLAIGPRWPTQLAFVVLALALVPALRLPAPAAGPGPEPAAGTTVGPRAGAGTPAGPGDRRTAAAVPWPAVGAAAGWLLATVGLVVPLTLRAFAGGAPGNGPLVAGGAAVAVGALAGTAAGRWRHPYRWLPPALLVAAGGLAGLALTRPAALALLCLLATAAQALLAAHADRAAEPGVGAVAVRTAAVPFGLAGGLLATPTVAVAAAALTALAGAAALTWAALPTRTRRAPADGADGSADRATRDRADRAPGGRAPQVPHDRAPGGAEGVPQPRDAGTGPERRPAPAEPRPGYHLYRPSSRATDPTEGEP
ncbi:hypothetical protein GCM10010124_10870 [Pilimelia terevasa]|uniref:Uncharacterized protein n=1 Tax=Pilimelia terevasa TaxID=53372 RepID=A0A8J3BML4_9ACTN|nr:hypothetical protein [Pilimelia terevasa]GGK20097.1 hypothetical protein GCM10010124_10870 [Pilimelia terevasa]